MKITLLISLILIVIILGGCQSETRVHSLNIPKESINFYQLKEVIFKELPDKLIRKKDYINLAMENGDNHITLIDKISYVNDKFYILDKRKKSLVVFDSTGNFISNIGEYKKDFLNIADFDVSGDGSVFIIDGKIDKVLYYDSSFNLVTTVKPPYEIDILKGLPSGNFLLGLSSWNLRANSHTKVLLADSKFNPLETKLMYDEFIDDNYWLSEYRFLKTDKNIFYYRPVDSDVYQFSLDGNLERSYYFDFGKMNIPVIQKKDIQKNLYNYANYRTLINFAFVNERFALGRIMDQRKERFFYINKSDSTVYLEDINTNGELKHIQDFNGKTLVSFIYPGEFNDKDFQSLPDASKAQLKKGGFVICKFELN